MEKNILRDDDGYALIITIVLVGILMLAGVLLSNTVITDLGIVKNEIIYTQNLAAAESAAMTAVQTLETKTNKEALDPATGTLEKDDSDKWINTFTEIPKDKDENCSDYATKWKSLTLDKLASRLSFEKAKIKYRVMCWKPAQGTSLGAHNQSILQEGRVRGVYSSAKYGATSVEMGYRKRF